MTIMHFAMIGMAVFAIFGFLVAASIVALVCVALGIRKIDEYEQREAKL